MVATHGCDGINLYVDGQLVAKDGSPGLPQGYLGTGTSGAEYLAGWPNSPTSNYFAGTISDAAIFDSPLSPSQQILSLYQASTAR